MCICIVTVYTVGPFFSNGSGINGSVFGLSGSLSCLYIVLLTICRPNPLAASHSCSTDLDVCKTLEDDDYSTLLWTSAAEIPGVFLTMFLLVMPCMGRKVVVTTEMALLTIFTGLLLVCADRSVDCLCP